jgi:hypothetical protein
MASATLLSRKGVALSRGGKALGRGGVSTSGPRDPDIVITNSDLPDGVVGQAYSVQIDITGGKPGAPKTYSATGLPAGSSIDADTGLISATALTGSAATYTPIVTVSDSNGSTSKSFSLAVTVTASLSISTGSLPAATVGTAYSKQMVAANVTGTPSWSATGLGAGLSINAGTGRISATSVGGSSGPRSVTVTVVDDNDVPVSRSYTLTVNAGAIEITTASLPGGVNGTAYSKQMAASGGEGTKVWSWTGAPGWASMSSSGLITGDPPNGTNSVEVAITVTATTTDTETFTLAWEPAPDPPPPAGALKGTMGFVLGDAGLASDIDLIMDHLTARRTALGRSGTHKVKTVRIQVPHPTIEPSKGAVAMPFAQEQKLVRSAARGLSIILLVPFTPRWAQRRDIPGMSMEGTIVGTNRIRFPAGIGKGFYTNPTKDQYGNVTPGAGLTIVGPGCPAGPSGQSAGWQCISDTDGNEFVISTRTTASNGEGIAAANLGAIGTSGTYQIGGTNFHLDQKLLVENPAWCYDTFYKLGEELAYLETEIILERWNERNHSPYARPKSYPELCSTEDMYSYAGWIAGSKAGGATYPRGFAPNGAAAVANNTDSTTPTAGDPRSGPNFLTSESWHNRWLNQMVINTTSPTLATSPWGVLRAAKGITAETSPRAYFTAYATHAYGEGHRAPWPSANADNAIYPGDPDTAMDGFENTAARMHNDGYNRGGTLGALLGSFLVHLTENGPSWAPPGDATVGIGWADPAIPDPTQKSIYHAHESFNYMMYVAMYVMAKNPVSLVGPVEWPGSVAWACGQTMIGTYDLFRGIGSVGNDPLNQACHSFLKGDGQGGHEMRWVGPTSGARTGGANNHWTGVKGYSLVDALAVAG